MNFLGHAILARAGSDELLLGALIADGIKGQQALSELSLDLRKGVIHHRRVDAMIDNHDHVRMLVRQMPQRRFAGIALDIVWDYYLHQMPARLTGGDLSPLIARCHRIVSSAAWLPPSHEAMLTNLVKGEWLVRSAERTFVMGSIRKVGSRLRNAQDLSASCQWIEQHELLLKDAFQAIWIDLYQQFSTAIDDVEHCLF